MHSAKMSASKGDRYQRMQRSIGKTIETINIKLDMIKKAAAKNEGNNKSEAVHNEKSEENQKSEAKRNDKNEKMEKSEDDTNENAGTQNPRVGETAIGNTNGTAEGSPER